MVRNRRHFRTEEPKAAREPVDVRSAADGPNFSITEETRHRDRAHQALEILRVMVGMSVHVASSAQAGEQ